MPAWDCRRFQNVYSVESLIELILSHRLPSKVQSSCHGEKMAGDSGQMFIADVQFWSACRKYSMMSRLSTLRQSKQFPLCYENSHTDTWTNQNAWIGVRLSIIHDVTGAMNYCSWPWREKERVHRIMGSRGASQCPWSPEVSLTEIHCNPIIPFSLSVDQ